MIKANVGAVYRAKSSLGIILKNLSLAAVLVLGLSQTAKADETNKHQNLRISCDPAINQSSQLNCSFNNLAEVGEDTVAQGGRGRRRKSKVQGYYGGFSAGIISPSGGIDNSADSDTPGLENLSDIDYSTGFGGSVFGGIKLNKTIGAELEFLLGFGSGDTDDVNDDFQAALEPLRTQASEAGLDFSGDLETDADYSIFAIYASPRFDLPVSEKFSVFISPGIGLSQTNINVSADNDLNFGGDLSPEQQTIADDANAQFQQANQDVDQSTTGISFKVKAGAEYQISNTIDIFGQATYVTLPVSDDDPSLDNLNSFLAQAGLTFNF